MYLKNFITKLQGFIWAFFLYTNKYYALPLGVREEAFKKVYGNKLKK